MKKLNEKGWGLSTMIGILIAFVLFLLIIVFLSYKVGGLFEYIVR
jgi:hypothetical protein